MLRRSELAKLPSVEPLIEGMLSLRAAAVLFGPTGAGKTFVALSWAYSVGTGTTWLGRAATRCRSLYVVGEGAFGLDHRVSALERAWGVEVDDESLIFSVKPASFTDRKTWAELTAEAVDLGVRFVLLDTFSSLAPDADETKDAPTFTRRLSDLAGAIDGTAVVVHHPGWSDSDRTRGGYQLEANVDEVLRLSGGPASPIVELTRKKVKEGPAGPSMWLRRKAWPLGEDENGKPYGSVVIEAARAHEVTEPMRERIVAVLRDVGDTGMTGPQILAATGTPDAKRGALYKALRGLVDDGAVGKEGKRRSERYSLPEEVSQP